MREKVVARILSAVDSLRGKHLRKIGEGHSRNVYRIQTNRFGREYKGMVAKVAKERRGRQSNSAEFRTWMSVKGTELEKFFCPIYDRTDDFRIVIMEKARTKEAGFKASTQIRQEMREKIDVDEIPVHTQRSMDISSDNVGFYNGRYVLVDYPFGGAFEIRDLDDM